MQGLMMDRPLLVSGLLQHADRHHGDTEIVSKTVDGSVHRYTYRDAHARARKLAGALQRLGVRPGERIATLAWNSYRHFEIYYAVAGSGAVIHTINPRLFPDQITYIANHAEDQYVFFDLSFAPLLEKLAPLLKTVKGYVAMCAPEAMPKANIPSLLCYEALLEKEKADFQWPTFDERTAACLCYTSGTTGNPKGALYGHRSTMLHAFGAALPDGLNVSARDVVLPVVPMFHVNAWGMTEMSPLGTVGSFKAKHAKASKDARDALQYKQGRAIYGVDMRIVGEDGTELPWDGKAFGDLQVRGPWVIDSYFKGEGGNPLQTDEHGTKWFPTGDVATIDPDGIMQITDRSKDVIKSGGEWISSIDLECIAMAHPAIAEAAVIGIKHPKWDERPIVVAVKKPGQEVSKEEVLRFYEGKIAKWWMPDDVVFVAELPHTATGKLSKLTLRENFREYRLPRT